MKNSKIIVTIAMQRCGTTAFANAISKHPNFIATHEVFLDRPENRRSKYNFYRFLDENNLGTLRNTHINPQNYNQVFDQYFECLRDVSANKYLFVDFKYDQLKLIRIINNTILNPLLDYLKQAEFPVIHIKRENPFLMSLSSQVMQITKKHFYNSGDVASIESISVDPEKCLQNIEAYYEVRDRVSKAFLDYKNYYELKYEEMYSGQNLSLTSSNILKEVTNQSGLQQLQTDTIKTPVKYSNLLKNKDEIISFFNTTSHFSLVKEVLG